MSSKPLSLEPYLEILRENVTGDKKASVRKYCREKIRKLTDTNVKETHLKKGRAGPGKPTPA